MRAFAYLAYLAAGLPLALCGLMALRGKDPKPLTWILSAGFFVSVLADSLGRSMQDAHLNNWWVTYAYPPIQYGLFLIALIRRGLVLGLVLGLVALMAVASILQGPLTAPEAVVQAAGAALVGFFVLSSPSGKQRRAIATYCLGTIPWLMLMAALPLSSAVWILAWVLYQVTRIVAIGLMASAILSPEDASGSRPDQTDLGQSGRPWTVSRGRGRGPAPPPQSQAQGRVRRVASR